MDEPPPFATLTSHNHVPFSDANEEAIRTWLVSGLFLCMRVMAHYVRPSFISAFLSVRIFTAVKHPSLARLQSG